MGNRFYIPRRDTGQDLMNIGQLGLQLYGLKQRGDIAASQQKLSEKELGMRGEELSQRRFISGKMWGRDEIPEEGLPATEGTEEAKIRLMGEASDIEKQKLAQAGGKMDMDQRDFGTTSGIMANKYLEKVGVSKDYFLMGKIKELVRDKNVNNATAYQELLREYPSYRYDLAEKIAEDFTKKSEKDPMYAQTPQGKEQNRLIEALDADETGERVIGSFFKETVASMQRREEAVRKPLTTDQYLAAQAQKEGLTAGQTATLVHPSTVKTPTLKEEKLKELWPSMTKEQKLKALDALPGTEKASFKDAKLKEIWGSLDDESKLKVLGALPADRELTEKNILDVYGNIFTDAETKKALQPIVEEITKRATAKNVGGQKKTNILPQGARQIGTYQGKPVFQTPEGKRFVQE